MWLCGKMQKRKGYTDDIANINNIIFALFDYKYFFSMPEKLMWLRT